MSDKGETLTHKWDEMGLGTAPFRVVCILTVPGPSVAEANPQAYNNQMADVSRSAQSFGVQLCSCYACGMSLMNNVIIRDANGKHFVVGLDCARKTYDSEVIAKAEKLERARQRKIRADKREEKRRKREAERDAEHAEQRKRNGGLTDWELSQKRQQEERDALARQHEEKNAWIIDVLADVRGGFAEDMTSTLSRRPLESLSPRQLEIVRDIYGKQMGGRRGSKKNQAALDEFDRLANVGE